MITQCATTYTKHINPDTLGEFKILIKESIRKVMLRLYTTKQELFKWSGTHTTNLLKATMGRGAVQSIESSIDLLKEIIFFRIETALTMEQLSWGKWHNCEEKCKWNISTFCKLGMYKISLELTIQI